RGANFNVSCAETVRPGPEPFSQDLGASDDPGDRIPDCRLGVIRMKQWGPAAFGAESIASLAPVETSTMRRLATQARAARRAAKQAAQKVQESPRPAAHH